ncbi:hypothetical protein L249_2129, partial [Ophiocordyceps polyrhachis-furcata BCC 54312]
YSPLLVFDFLCDEQDGVRPFGLHARTCATTLALSATPLKFTHLQRKQTKMADQDDFQTPLFAHESFGEYKTVVGHTAGTPRDASCYDAGGDADKDDPTLEMFPSDRSSVFEALRKIRSAYDQHHPHSPRAMASSGEVAIESSSSPRSRLLSPTKGGEGRGESDGPIRRSASLGPIAEEPRCNESPARSGKVGKKEVVAARPTDDRMKSIKQKNQSCFSTRILATMAPTAACLRCSFALGCYPTWPRVVVQTPLRQARCLSRQARPSRMVLAEKVHRSPASPRLDRQKRILKDSVQGPFAGMNRKHADFLPPRDAAPLQRRVGASTTRSSTERTPPPSSSRMPEESSRSAARGSNRTVDRTAESAVERTMSSSSSQRMMTGRLRRDNRPPPQDDRKALNMQRALATVPYGLRMAIKDRMLRFDSFEQFDLLPIIKTAVRDELFRDMIDICPTPVQRLAIPALLGQPSPDLPKRPNQKMQSFLLAAETGSGKTLAYLLPVIDALKLDEGQDQDILAYKQRAKAMAAAAAANAKLKPLDEPHPTMARPRVVVLVPTAELAEQVMRVCKLLSHVVKFKTEMLSSDLKPQVIQRNLYGPKGLDVVISTPHLLSSIADSDPNILARVSHLIVDEADSLLDRSFSPVTTSIMQRAMPSLKQLVCCSATIPRKLNDYLAAQYPNMTRITTPNLHAIPRRVVLGVIDVSKDPYRNNRDLACADVIYSIGKDASLQERTSKGKLDVRRVLVFVNERAKTEEVAQYLRSQGIDAEALHRDAVDKRQGDALQTFTSDEPLHVPAPATPGRRRSLDNVKVMVATDIASRGIDTLPVRHVILYDVPHSTIDFIHRLGRAGRMGRRGREEVYVHGTGAHIKEARTYIGGDFVPCLFSFTIPAT